MNIKSKMQGDVLERLNIEIPALEKDAEGKLKGGFCSVVTFGLEDARSGMGNNCTGGHCNGDHCTGTGCSGDGCVGNNCTGDNCTGDVCTGKTCTGNFCKGEKPTEPTKEDGTKSMAGFSLVF